MRAILVVSALAAAILPISSAYAAANPASVYCKKFGGKNLIVQTDDGEMGVCLLKNGKAVEEWKYFRDNNDRGDEPPLGSNKK